MLPDASKIMMMALILLFSCRNKHNIVQHHSVCTKGSRFPYILLLTQEVGCLLCCYDDITPCACALHGASAQRMRIIFAATKYSVLTLLLAINIMFAYGAVPPKVIGLRRGHPGEQHIIAYFQI